MKDRSAKSWRKSSHSAGQEACVELRTCDGSGTQVRDSRDPNGPKLTFSIEDWRSFHSHVLST